MQMYCTFICIVLYHTIYQFTLRLVRYVWWCMYMVGREKERMAVYTAYALGAHGVYIRGGYLGEV